MEQRTRDYHAMLCNSSGVAASPTPFGTTRTHTFLATYKRRMYLPLYGFNLRAQRTIISELQPFLERNGVLSPATHKLCKEADQTNNSDAPIAEFKRRFNAICAAVRDSPEGKISSYFAWPMLNPPINSPILATPKSEHTRTLPEMSQQPNSRPYPFGARIDVTLSQLVATVRHTPTPPAPLNHSRRQSGRLEQISEPRTNGTTRIALGLRKHVPLTLRSRIFLRVKAFNPSSTRRIPTLSSPGMQRRKRLNTAAITGCALAVAAIWMTAPGARPFTLITRNTLHGSATRGIPTRILGPVSLCSLQDYW